MYGVRKGTLWFRLRTYRYYVHENETIIKDKGLKRRQTEMGCVPMTFISHSF
ncbi:MAG: hypothetical protein ACQERB_16590 [Promethearchaeati archaeon]